MIEKSQSDHRQLNSEYSPSDSDTKILRETKLGETISTSKTEESKQELSDNKILSKSQHEIPVGVEPTMDSTKESKFNSLKISNIFENVNSSLNMRQDLQKLEEELDINYPELKFEIFHQSPFKPNTKSVLILPDYHLLPNSDRGLKLTAEATQVMNTAISSETHSLEYSTSSL